jgi:hypothetical protein
MSPLLLLPMDSDGLTVRHVRGPRSNIQHPRGVESRVRPGAGAGLRRLRPHTPLGDCWWYSNVCTTEI